MPNIHAYDKVLGHSLTPNDPRQVIALRAAHNDPKVIQLILDKRARYKEWVTLQQRRWQTKVSKRPQRGNHHDSHTIREKYVRC